MRIPFGLRTAATPRSRFGVALLRIVHACLVVCVACVATVAAADVAPAQPRPSHPAAARPSTSDPVERAATLAAQAAAFQLDEPARAVAGGREALALLAAAPETKPAQAARVAAHSVMAAAYTALGRYDSAAVAAEEGRRLAERSGDQPGVAHALSSLGALAQRRGDPGGAVAHFTRALAIQRTLGADSAAAMSLTYLGFLHTTDLADYDQGLTYLRESLGIRERIGGDAEGLATTLNCLGIVYGRLRQPERALEHFQRALALHRSAGATARAASTLSNMGDLLLERGDAEGALVHHRESLALREGVGDRWALSLARRNIGLTYLAMGRAEAAHAEVTAALELGGETGNRGLAARNLLALAAVERARGRPAAAERAAGEALTVASAMGARELVRRAWEALADAQEAGGRFEAALASQRGLRAVSDSIFDETTARRIAALDERHEAERRERAIERLTSAQAFSALQAQQRAMQRNGIAGAAILLGLLGAVAYRRRARAAERAETLSLTDPLTGVRNRRFVREVVARDMAARPARPARLAGPRGEVFPADASLAFLLLDIDHFKRVNDTLGHQAGDHVLSELARVLETTCGPSDVVARWGGEEFLVVSRCADPASACDLAERIRAAVAAHVAAFDGGRTLSVTCSIGFALIPCPPAGSAWSWEAAVALADHGTYAAKSLGRDAWVGYAAAAHVAPPTWPMLCPELIDAWVADGRLHSHDSAERRQQRAIA